MAAGIATETETVDTAADQEKKSHANEDMKQTVMKKTLASCEDTRWNRARVGLSCGGFLEYSVSPPFITRGKPFSDAVFTKITKVIWPSPVVPISYAIQTSYQIRTAPKLSW